MDPKKPPPLQPRFADAFFRNRESRLFRRLPGFDPAKRHKPPTELSERASAWAGRLLHETMRAELDTVYRNAKVLLGLRRRDIKLQTVDGAGGTLETKFFSYIVDADQADTDPSEAVIERRIVLHASPHDLPDNLDQVFPVAIDEIVVPLTEDGLDFDRLVDSLEDACEAVGARLEENERSGDIDVMLDGGLLISLGTKRRSMVIRLMGCEGCLNLIEAMQGSDLPAFVGDLPLIMVKSG